MNALDLKFDTDYRVIVEGSYFFKGDIVRREASSLDDEWSVKFVGSSGDVVGFLSIGDVEEIIPYDPQSESHCGNSGLPKDSTHYQHTLLQPLEIMQRIMTPEEFKGFLKGNILKYSIRGGNKQGEPAEKDLGKVETYSRWLRLAEQGKTINPMLD